MSENLFSYGTLQKTETQKNLFGRTLEGKTDRLDGYMISEIEIRDEEFLAEGEEKIQKTLVPTGICGDFVEGTVLRLTEEELLIVDSYEPANYKRIAMHLESGLEAWIYLRV